LTLNYFNISKKSNYAIKALFELALRSRNAPVCVRALAKAQGIPTRFLEIILNDLKHGGFVRSIRGKSGGYLLAQSPEEITIAQIIRFLEKSPESTDTPAQQPKHRGDFVLKHAITRINRAISDICDEMTLKDMLDEEQKNRTEYVSNYVI
jgi:Rrf2 family cysteine metabolism transcriptional repressor